LRIGLNGTAYDELSSGARDRFLNLYAAVGELSPGNEFLIYSPREFSLIPAFRATVAGGTRTPFSPSRPLRRFLFSRSWFNRRVAEDRADLFVTDHFPVIESPPLGTLLTIHDLRYLVLDDAGGPLRRAWFKARFARTAARARAVVTVSHSMRAQIIERLELPPEKVHVVGNGIHRGFRRAAEEEIVAYRRRHELPSEYLLTVGVLEKRKNLGLLLEVYRRDEGRSLPPLLIVGRGGPEEATLRGVVARAGLDARVQFRGYVPEAELPPLFSGAAALLMPSLYEGFGIPVIQAFACRTPVVCSDTGALAEVAGEAALKVDPLDPEAWSQAMAKVLEDSGLRDRLSVAGRARADSYSWTAAAREFLGVLDALSC
jgi:glycosyltransferase involved in cell wall biosynthesis